MVAQIELTDEQTRALERLAAVRGQSVPELILTSVEALISRESTTGREDLRQRALELSGRFRSGLTDLSVEHDRYLEDAFGD
jgi:hypothetical protein